MRIVNFELKNRAEISKLKEDAIKIIMEKDEFVLVYQKKNDKAFVDLLCCNMDRINAIYSAELLKRHAWGDSVDE